LVCRPEVPRKLIEVGDVALVDRHIAALARRWRRNAWIVGVHGPAARRTVFPTRTTAVMLPPDRISSRSAADHDATP
jgi:hypothetical protein